MKIKIITIFILVLLITGCDATYNISIKNKQVEEKISLLETDNKLFDVPNSANWTLRKVVDSMIKKNEFAKELYDIEKVDKVDELGIKATSKFLLSDYKNSTILNQCYENLYYVDNGETINIMTNSRFLCYDYYDNLDLITIKLYTNHVVKFNNADSVKGNTYIWKLNKDNYENKSISIEFYKEKTRNGILPYVIITLIIIIIVVFSRIVYKRNKSNNEI